MTWQIWTWIVGIVPWAIAGCIQSEHERQLEIASLHHFGRHRSAADLEQATLRCGLDGIVVGIGWPFVAAFLVLLGVVWLFSLPGRLAR